MFSFFGQSKPVIEEKPKTWGDYTFNFSLRTHGASLYQTSVLYAEATGDNQLPIPIYCKWFRIRGNRTYQIEEISSSIYQLNAEDIGCMIKVEATPINIEEGEGQAFGLFGPVQLDPSARQILEQVLGTGGSQFPVTITLSGKQRSEEESLDAKLFVSQHLIKICFEDQGASVGSSFTEDVISLKYTIDFPRVEMHPFDTTRFFIFYDKSETIDAHYDFNKKIDLRALSRQSRDLIALCLKCFSAQTYLMNSKIISSLPDLPPLKQSLADLLLELEQVKKDLGNQIQIAKGYLNERQMLRKQLESLEEEMHCTIQSYRQVLEQSNCGELQSKSNAEMTVSILTQEKSELQSQEIILNDQIQSLQLQLQDSNQRLSNLVKQNLENNSKAGIPVAQQVSEKLEISVKELNSFKQEQQMQMKKVKNEFAQKIKLLEAENAETKRLMAEKQSEMQEFKKEHQSSASEQQSKELYFLNIKLEEANLQNSQLLLQRKNLSKAKDSIQQELVQTISRLDSIQLVHASCADMGKQFQDKFEEALKKQAEHHKSEIESHHIDIQRIEKQNNRLTEEIFRLQNDLEVFTQESQQKITKLENSLLQKEKDLLLVGQQLRMQLAKKTINKLSEVIGIKTILTAMNVESDSEEEQFTSVTTNQITQTEPTYKIDVESQTDQEETQQESSINLDELQQNLNKVDSSNHDLNKLCQEILKLKQFQQIMQMEHNTGLEQLRQQLSKKDAQIMTLSNEMQTLAIRLCAAQEQLADM